MAGHEYRDAVAPVRLSDGADGRALADNPGKLAIAARLAAGYPAQRRPDFLLERRARLADRQVEVFPIPGVLPGGIDRRV